MDGFVRRFCVAAVVCIAFGFASCAAEDLWLEGFAAARKKAAQDTKPPVGKEFAPELIVAHDRGLPGSDVVPSDIAGQCICAFSPDGRTAALAWWTDDSDSGVILFDLETKQARKLMTGVALDMAFSPDGTALAACIAESVPAEEMALTVTSLKDGGPLGKAGNSKVLLTLPFSIKPEKASIITACAWLSADQLAAYEAVDGEIRIELVNVRDGKSERLFTGTNEQLAQLGIPEDQRRIPCPLTGNLSIGDGSDIYFDAYPRIYRLNAKTRAAAAFGEGVELGKIAINPHVDRQGRRLLVVQSFLFSTSFCVSEPDLKGSVVVARNTDGLAADDVAMAWFPDGEHFAATNLQSLVLAAADGTRKIETKMPKDAPCWGVWTLPGNSLVILTGTCIWKLNVAEQLKKIDAMPIPKAEPEKEAKYEGQDSPASAVRTFMEAARRGDITTVKSCADAQARAEIEKLKPDELEQHLADAKELAAGYRERMQGEPAVKIDGDTAQVTWQGDDNSLVFSLKKEDKLWRIVEVNDKGAGTDK